MLAQNTMCHPAVRICSDIPCHCPVLILWASQLNTGLSFSARPVGLICEFLIPTSGATCGFTPRGSGWFPVSLIWCLNIGTSLMIEIEDWPNGSKGGGTKEQLRFSQYDETRQSTCEICPFPSAAGGIEKEKFPSSNLPRKHSYFKRSYFW